MKITNNLIELIHLLFCNKNHSTNECNFYDESIMESCWNMPEHLFWTDNTTKIFDQVGIKSVDSAIKALNFICKFSTMQPEQQALIKLWILSSKLSELSGLSKLNELSELNEEEN